MPRAGNDRGVHRGGYVRHHWGSDCDLIDRAALVEKGDPDRFLATMAAIIAVPLALFLGVLAALYRNSWYDRIVNSVTLTTIATPEFFIAYMLPANSKPSIIAFFAIVRSPALQGTGHNP